MPKDLCLLQSNCQGEPLAQLLLAQPGFAASFDILRYTNYTHDPVGDDELSQASLFLYQPLGDNWGPIASGVLLPKLRPGVRALALANPFFMGYWPLHVSRPDFNFSDQFLDHLLSLGLGKTEILHVYLRGDLTKKYDLAALHQACVERERAKEAECEVATVDFILEAFRREQLFWTVNHPGHGLMRHMADQVLTRLGFAALSDEQAASVPEEFREFHQPIHPQVSRFFALDFGREDELYNIYGLALTFEQYAGLYIDAKLAGVTDFIDYLLGLSA